MDRWFADHAWAVQRQDSARTFLLIDDGDRVVGFYSLARGPLARTHVILADEVIAATNERVGERGRSRFLEEAAREKLERLELEAAIRDGAGLLKDKDYPHWRDTDSVKEWVRTSRRGELTAHDVPAR